MIKFKVLCFSVYVIGHKQKISRKIVPYMVGLVVEDHGIIDLYFLYNFDNIPKKIKSF